MIQASFEDRKQKFFSAMTALRFSSAGGPQWYETDKDILDFLYQERPLPPGVEQPKYFIYENCFICEHGKRKEIEHEMSRSLGERLHGAKEGTFDR